MLPWLLVLSLLGVVLNISNNQIPGKIASGSYNFLAPSLSSLSIKKNVFYYLYIKFKVREDSNWPFLNGAPTSNPVTVAMGRGLLSLATT